MSVTNVYSQRYPYADTYTGHAAHEIDHHEFIKLGYSVDSAVGSMVSAVEEVVNQNGYVLLTMDINYDDSGYVYHVFEVDYKFTDPSLAVQTVGIQNNIVQQMQIPPTLWIPLITAIIALLDPIIYYFLANAFVKNITDMMYSPGSDTSGGLSTTTVIKYGVILVAAAYFLSALTKTSQELRR